jgi:hypothetical protein
MGVTQIHQLPYPEPPDPADVPSDMRALAEAVDAIVTVVPAVVNGQWLRGVGGVPVWQPIRYLDVPGTPRYSALVAANGTLGWATGSIQVAHPGTGTYNITVTGGFQSTMAPIFVTATSAGVIATGAQTGAAAWTVTTAAAGSALDAAFYFVVFDMATLQQ